MLVEAAIVGREIECGVLEGEAGGAPEPSLLAEIHVVTDHEFYDFEAKYLDNAQPYDIPAALPDDGDPPGAGATPARPSPRWTAPGWPGSTSSSPPTNEIYLNEINTMPGFTPTSMFPLMWAATGLEYPKVVNRLIRTALRRGTGLH